MPSEPKVTPEMSTATQHVEIMDDEGLKTSDPAFDAVMRGQVTTGYESLSALETIKTFRICTLVCFAMAFSAATDGYQIGYVDFMHFILTSLRIADFKPLPE
jgi:hypothetical protein